MKIDINKKAEEFLLMAKKEDGIEPSDFVNELILNCKIINRRANKLDRVVHFLNRAVENINKDKNIYDD